MAGEKGDVRYGNAQLKTLCRMIEILVGLGNLKKLQLRKTRLVEVQPVIDRLLKSNPQSKNITKLKQPADGDEDEDDLKTFATNADGIEFRY